MSDKPRPDMAQFDNDEATRLASLRIGATIIGVIGVLCWAATRAARAQAMLERARGE